MKLRTSLAVLVSACLLACGGSSDEAPSSSGGASSSSPSAERITDPEKLPSDRDGLVKVYKSLIGDVAGILEGVETEEQLEPALDKVAAFGPAFAAVMKRGENLELPVDDRSDDEMDALVQRMEQASRKLAEKFPTQALAIMGAFTEAMGGVDEY